MRNRLYGHFVVVYPQDAGTAFAEAGTVVLEVTSDRVLARRKHFRAFPTIALQVEHVVAEHRLAFEKVERVSAEAAALRDQHALRAAFARETKGTGLRISSSALMV